MDEQVFERKNKSLIARYCSQNTLQSPFPSQRRAVIHRSKRKDTQKYGREYECEGEMVEYLPVRSVAWGRNLPGLVVEEIL